MIKKIIAIDLIPMEYVAKSLGFPYLPVAEIRNYCARDNVDIIETLVTLPQRLPDDDTDEAFGRVTKQNERKRYALQMSGARVIDCPAKSSLHTSSGYKQSDDQRLMLTTLMLSMKLRPDYVMLFAADGDFAPMVEILRGEGIRTEVVATKETVAKSLLSHAVKYTDYFEMLNNIKVFSPVFLDQQHNF